MDLSDYSSDGDDSSDVEEIIPDYDLYREILEPLSDSHTGEPFKWISFVSAGIMPPKLQESLELGEASKASTDASDLKTPIAAQDGASADVQPPKDAGSNPAQKPAPNKAVIMALSALDKSDENAHFDRDYAKFAKSGSFGYKIIAQHKMLGGLGKHSSGIINPVLARVRPPYAGIGSIPEDKEGYTAHSPQDAVSAYEKRLAKQKERHDEEIKQLLERAGLSITSTNQDDVISSIQEEELRKQKNTIQKVDQPISLSKNAVASALQDFDLLQNTLNLASCHSVWDNALHTIKSRILHVKNALTRDVDLEQYSQAQIELNRKYQTLFQLFDYIQREFEVLSDASTTTLFYFENEDHLWSLLQDSLVKFIKSEHGSHNVLSGGACQSTTVDSIGLDDENDIMIDNATQMNVQADDFASSDGLWVAAPPPSCRTLSVDSKCTPQELSIVYMLLSSIIHYRIIIVLIRLQLLSSYFIALHALIQRVSSFAQTHKLDLAEELINHTGRSADPQQRMSSSASSSNSISLKITNFFHNLLAPQTIMSLFQDVLTTYHHQVELLASLPLFTLPSSSLWDFLLVTPHESPLLCPTSPSHETISSLFTSPFHINSILSMTSYFSLLRVSSLIQIGAFFAHHAFLCIPYVSSANPFVSVFSANCRSRVHRHAFFFPDGNAHGEPIFFSKSSNDTSSSSQLPSRFDTARPSSHRQLESVGVSQPLDHSITSLLVALHYGQFSIQLSSDSAVSSSSLSPHSPTHLRSIAEAWCMNQLDSVVQTIPNISPTPSSVPHRQHHHQIPAEITQVSTPSTCFFSSFHFSFVLLFYFSALQPYLCPEVPLLSHYPVVLASLSTISSFPHVLPSASLFSTECASAPTSTTIFQPLLDDLDAHIRSSANQGISPPMICNVIALYSMLQDVTPNHAFHALSSVRFLAPGSFTSSSAASSIAAFSTTPQIDTTSFRECHWLIQNIDFLAPPLALYHSAWNIFNHTTIDSDVEDDNDVDEPASRTGHDSDLMNDSDSNTSPLDIAEDPFKTAQMQITKQISSLFPTVATSDHFQNSQAARPNTTQLPQIVLSVPSVFLWAHDSPLQSSITHSIRRSAHSDMIHDDLAGSIVIQQSTQRPFSHKSLCSTSPPVNIFSASNESSTISLDSTNPSDDGFNNQRQSHIQSASGGGSFSFSFLQKMPDVHIFHQLFTVLIYPIIMTSINICKPQNINLFKLCQEKTSSTSKSTISVHPIDPTYVPLFAPATIWLTCSEYVTYIRSIVLSCAMIAPKLVFSFCLVPLFRASMTTLRQLCQIALYSGVYHITQPSVTPPYFDLLSDTSKLSPILPLILSCKSQSYQYHLQSIHSLLQNEQTSTSPVLFPFSPNSPTNFNSIQYYPQSCCTLPYYPPTCCDMNIVRTFHSFSSQYHLFITSLRDIHLALWSLQYLPMIFGVIQPATRATAQTVSANLILISPSILQLILATHPPPSSASASQSTGLIAHPPASSNPSPIINIASLTTKVGQNIIQSVFDLFDHIATTATPRSTVLASSTSPVGSVHIADLTQPENDSVRGDPLSNPVCARHAYSLLLLASSCFPRAALPNELFDSISSYQSISKRLSTPAFIATHSSDYTFHKNRIAAQSKNPHSSSINESVLAEQIATTCSNGLFSLLPIVTYAQHITSIRSSPESTALNSLISYLLTSFSENLKLLYPQRPALSASSDKAISTIQQLLSTPASSLPDKFKPSTTVPASIDDMQVETVPPSAHEPHFTNGITTASDHDIWLLPSHLAPLAVLPSTFVTTGIPSYLTLQIVEQVNASQHSSQSQNDRSHPIIIDSIPSDQHPSPVTAVGALSPQHLFPRSSLCPPSAFFNSFPSHLFPTSSDDPFASYSALFLDRLLSLFLHISARSSSSSSLPLSTCSQDLVHILPFINVLPARLFFAKIFNPIIILPIFVSISTMWRYFTDAGCHVRISNSLKSLPPPPDVSLSSPTPFPFGIFLNVIFPIIHRQLLLVAVSSPIQLPLRIYTSLSSLHILCVQHLRSPLSPNQCGLVENLLQYTANLIDESVPRHYQTALPTLESSPPPPADFDIAIDPNPPVPPTATAITNNDLTTSSPSNTTAPKPSTTTSTACPSSTTIPLSSQEPSLPPPPVYTKQQETYVRNLFSNKQPVHFHQQVDFILSDRNIPASCIKDVSPWFIYECGSTKNHSNNSNANSNNSNLATTSEMCLTFALNDEESCCYLFTNGLLTHDDGDLSVGRIDLSDRSQARQRKIDLQALTSSRGADPQALLAKWHPIGLLDLIKVLKAFV